MNVTLARTASSAYGRARALLLTGLLLTVAVTVHALLDPSTTRLLTSHVRAGYPSYAPQQIDAAVMAYVAILTVAGGLGVVSWLVSLWATASGRSWARWFSLGALLSATTLALTGLTVRDTSGDVGLAPVMGWLQILPILAGMTAVAMLWSRPSLHATAGGVR